MRTSLPCEVREGLRCVPAVVRPVPVVVVFHVFPSCVYVCMYVCMYVCLYVCMVNVMFLRSSDQSQLLLCFMISPAVYMHSTPQMRHLGLLISSKIEHYTQTHRHKNTHTHMDTCIKNSRTYLSTPQMGRFGLSMSSITYAAMKSTRLGTCRAWYACMYVHFCVHVHVHMFMRRDEIYSVWIHNPYVGFYLNPHKSSVMAVSGCNGSRCVIKILSLNPHIPHASAFMFEHTHTYIHAYTQTPPKIQACGSVAPIFMYIHTYCMCVYINMHKCV
jgi:hypothetical protein